MSPMAIRAPYGRRALRANPSRQPTASSSFIPPPVAGWDTQSPFAAMKADHAVRLDNFIPRQGYCELRKGSATFATGVGSPVQTLMVWRGPTSEKMFAATASNVLEVTDGGAAQPTAFLDDQSSGLWQYTNFGTPGGQFIVAVNGSDNPVNFDGTDWANAPSITGSGLDATALIDVFAHKQRVYFIEKDSSRFWYLDPIAIGGTAHSYDLASIFTKGGHLVAGATWSIDGGAGQEDLACFISTEGQVAVYNGIDPGNAEDWALVGTFDIARPVTRRCFIKLGADLGVLTEGGLLPLKTTLIGLSTSNNPNAITRSINDVFVATARKFFGSSLWQPIAYERSALLIVNAPKSSFGLSEQYVMNLTNGSWCRFLGMNANCWAIFNGLLYFGSNGVVNQADVGFQDVTTPIIGDMITAYSDFKSPSRFKHFVLTRPILRTGASSEPLVEMITDFSNSSPDSSPVLSQSANDWPTAIWQESIWGTARWGQAQHIHMAAGGSKGMGIYGAARLRMSTTGTDQAVGSTSTSALQVMGFDVHYQSGGPL